MYVLDTHTLIWWVSGDSRLSASARMTIETARAAGDVLIVSSITAWEIAMLVDKGRLQLTMDVDSWLATVEQIENLDFYPVNNKVAIESTRLPGEFHKDPADRMIVALTRVLSATLISADEKILNYSHVKTLSA